MKRIVRSHTTPYFEKQFKRLPRNLQRLAATKLLFFEETPFHPGLRTHKLKGELSSFWAFWVNAHYRVLFRFISDREVIYYDIDTHEIYR